MIILNLFIEFSVNSLSSTRFFQIFQKEDHFHLKKIIKKQIVHFDVTFKAASKASINKASPQLDHVLFFAAFKNKKVLLRVINEPVINLNHGRRIFSYSLTIFMHIFVRKLSMLSSTISVCFSRNYGGQESKNIFVNARDAVHRSI